VRALILSGGRGTRLRPITHTSAKQLVPVANKPILFYGIEAMREAGITEVGIVVGDTHQEIRDAAGDGSRFGVKITYIRQDAPLGLAHAVLVSEDFLKDQPFVMYLGDNLVRDGIRPLVEEFRRDQPNCQILLAHVKNPQEFGVAELDGERVARLEEKPARPRSDLALVGVYMFDSHVFEAVRAIKPSRRGELEITDAIQYLIDKKFDVRSHVVAGWWKDTGKLEDMLEANRMMLENVTARNDGVLDESSRLEGRVIIGKGSRVERSTLRGPLIVGEKCVIRDAYVGPFTSISNECVIDSSEIEHSIVLERSRIERLEKRVEGSLVGKDVVIRTTDARPRSYRFMIGDSCSVDVV
jgi:glucose-1-phosphate thymidylyltransferase